jgi:eukaryotic-like serine/threonine-protein kinase
MKSHLQLPLLTCGISKHTMCCQWQISYSLVGKTLSPYRVIEQIGAGGMGIVYRALGERLERNVALKVLTPALLYDQGFLSKFRKAALLFSKLNHPNIATVHEFDSVGGMSFLVM